MGAIPATLTPDQKIIALGAARSVLGPHHHALEEVVDHVRYQLPAANPYPPPDGWIFLVARNKALDIRRKEWRLVSMHTGGRTGDGEEGGAIDLPGPDGSPADSSAARAAARLALHEVVRPEATLVYLAHRILGLSLARIRSDFGPMSLRTMEAELSARLKALPQRNMDWDRSLSALRSALDRPVPNEESACPAFVGDTPLAAHSLDLERGHDLRPLDRALIKGVAEADGTILETTANIRPPHQTLAFAWIRLESLPVADWKGLLARTLAELSATFLESHTAHSLLTAPEARKRWRAMDEILDPANLGAADRKLRDSLESPSGDGQGALSEWRNQVLDRLRYRLSQKPEGRLALEAWPLIDWLAGSSRSVRTVAGGAIQ